MATRSIHEVDLKDESFQRFYALFLKYQEQLKAMPGAWGKVEDAVKDTSSHFIDQTAALMAQAEAVKRVAKEEEKAGRTTASTGRVFTQMARDTLVVSRNIISATASLLKWAGLTGIVSGLVGAGGIWGIDRLAISAGNARREAQGLGLSSGQQQAFEINYQRYVEPDSFLGNINDIIHDQTKQYGLGGKVAQLHDQGFNTADIAAAIIPELRSQFIQGGQTEQGRQAYGLQNFASLQDLLRLAANKPEDIDASRAGYRRDAGTLAVGPDIQKQWQEFSNQMQRAGQQIENTFIKDLIPLEPGLEKLSASFANVVDTFLKSDQVKVWLTDLSDGLGTFARYLDSPSFKTDVEDFVTDVGKLARAIKDALQWLVGDPSKTPATVFSAPGVTVQKDERGPLGRLFGKDTPAPQLEPDAVTRGLRDLGKWLGAPSPKWDSGNNPGGLRVPGKSEFQSFATPEDGVRAIAKQLGLYQDRDHISTIDGLIGKWAPPSENDTESYIRDVAKTTGFERNSALNLHDPNVLAKLTAAITKHEGRRTFTPAAVQVIVNNNTGGSAIITGNQVAQ